MDRGAQGDSLKLSGKKHQAFDRGYEMSSPLGPGHCMHFVQDDGLDASQKTKSAAGREQDVQALRRGNQYPRLLLDHPSTLGLRRITASRQRPD